MYKTLIWEPKLLARQIWPKLALVLIAMTLFFAPLPTQAEGAPNPPTAIKGFITLGATTSAYDSGLLSHIREAYAKKINWDLKLVIKGTGRILDIGRRGDLDLVLVHDRASEDAFLADGYAISRTELMFNDFLIVGPRRDPAKIRGLGLNKALQALAEAGETFASRGDNSGTHKAELRLWESVDMDPITFDRSWYKKLGAGMGATLNVASTLNAYTLTDRGTWIAFGNKGDLEILVSNAPALRNVYALLPVSNEIFPHVKAKETADFVAWLTASEGQNLIQDFHLEGQQLFFPLHLDTPAKGD